MATPVPIHLDIGFFKKIAEGIDFDTIARELCCKWSADNDEASLVEARKAIDSIPIAF